MANGSDHREVALAIRWSVPAAVCSIGKSCPGPAAVWPGAARNLAGIESVSALSQILPHPDVPATMSMPSTNGAHPGSKSLRYITSG